MGARHAAPAKLPPRVTLIYGNQEHAMERAAETLLDAVLGAGPRDFSLQRFDAEALLKPGPAAEPGSAVDDFRAACDTVPFLTERYVVQLKHVERVKPGSRRQARAAVAGGSEGRAAPRQAGAVDGDAQPELPEQAGAGTAGPGSPTGRLLQTLQRVMATPPEGCWLLLLANAKAERELPKALLEAARRHGAVQKFVTYDDYEPIPFVLDEARSLGLALQREHARWLIQVMGNDQGRLARELEKLALLFGRGAAPDEAQWRAAIHGEGHASTFFINEKLGEKDLAGALSVLEQFLGSTPNELPVLVGILARHLRQLHLLQELQRSTGADGAMAARLNLHPFLLRRLQQQAVNFQPEELEQALRALAAVDLGFRRHGQIAGVALRDFVQRLCLGWFRTDAPGGLPTT